jgi:hypothetical protein
MSMIYVGVLVATNLWWKNRESLGAHHFILRNIPFLFEVIEALYLETRKLPLHSRSGVQSNQIEKDYVLTIGMFLQSDEYATLRSILSLTGDIYNLTTPLLKIKDGSLLELEASIRKLFDCANIFRGVRNFFTHLDDVLTNMDKHGITGATSTDCGIQYTDKARGCVHLVWKSDDNSIHFTYRGGVYKTTIEKSAFNSIFTAARELYSNLVTPEMYANQNDYLPPEKLFPL